MQRAIAPVYLTAAYAQQMQQAQQQQQLAPQGWFGNLIGQVGQPLGGAIGGIFGQQGLGSSIGNVAGQIGKLLPFGAEPTAGIVPLQLLQQIQQLQQQYQQQVAQLVAQHQQQQQAQQAQQGKQGQLGPQGWLGNLIGKAGRPLSSMISSTFGSPGLGNTIGGGIAQLGQMLQGQVGGFMSSLLPQQALGAPIGGIGNMTGARAGQLDMYGMDPVMAAFAALSSGNYPAQFQGFGQIAGMPFGVGTPVYRGAW